MGLFCQLSVVKIGIDEKSFNEFLYFLELFTTVFCVCNYSVQTERNYTVGTKRLCCELPQISLIKFLVFLFSFVHMVSTGKFLLQMLQTKVAFKHTEDTVMHRIEVAMGTGFGIDFPENEQICSFIDFQVFVGNIMI